MKEPGPNLSASIHQRLLHISRSTGQDFQQLLTRFAIERLLVRLIDSKHADEFILKGAMLFVIWIDEPYRPTVDLDQPDLVRTFGHDGIQVFRRLLLQDNATQVATSGNAALTARLQ